MARKKYRSRIESALVTLRHLKQDWRKYDFRERDMAIGLAIEYLEDYQGN